MVDPVPSGYNKKAVHRFSLKKLKCPFSVKIRLKPFSIDLGKFQLELIITKYFKNVGQNLVIPATVGGLRGANSHIPFIFVHF